jgi:hypothetical protein
LLAGCRTRRDGADRMQQEVDPAVQNHRDGGGDGAAQGGGHVSLRWGGLASGQAGAPAMALCAGKHSHGEA